MKPYSAIAALLMLTGTMSGQNVSTMPAYQTQPDLLNPGVEWEYIAKGMAARIRETHATKR